jgi:glycosyltransferase involved in cell wall biosynthesis
MIYYIPIEPLEERYTEQWYRWFPDEFKRQGLEFTVIDGETLTNVVETGTFLDVNSTLYYKSEQLKKIAQLFYKKEIKNGDVFFVADIEFWGIDSIKYLSVLNGIDTKLYGFAHAGSYTIEDYFAKCAPFAQHYETAWGAIFDQIFVGSEYHKGQMIKLRGIPDNKITVTGNPYDVKEAKGTVVDKEKKNRIILTNRPDYEKRPNLTLDVFTILKERHPDWEFMVTTSRKQWGSGWIREKGKFLEKEGVITIKEGLSKNEYLSLLQESKVMTSNSIEENFGYCILEALIFQTIPVLPKGFSHDELVGKNFLFNDLNQQIDIIEKNIIDYDIVTNSYPGTFSVNQYELALRKIVALLK